MKYQWKARLVFGFIFLVTGCGMAQTDAVADIPVARPVVNGEALVTERETMLTGQPDIETRTDAKTDVGAGTETESGTKPNPDTEKLIELSEEPEREAEQPPLPVLEIESGEWGLGFGEAGTQPVGNAPAADLEAYHAYYVGDDTEPVIYLTFDCGYENGNTEAILDALEKHRVPATFFVVGHFLESAPELVKRMAQDGHAVGNHTYHHPDLAAIADAEAFQKELDDVAALYYEITGKELDRYYRPPAGKCNADNLRMAKDMGYATVFWSLAYVDWEQDSQPSHEEAFAKLTGRIHPGAIVLLHNTSQTNGEILDELLTRWEDMGYCFRPLSELVE